MFLSAVSRKDLVQYHVIQTLRRLPESIRDILDAYRDKLDLPQTCVESFRDYLSQHSSRLVFHSNGPRNPYRCLNLETR